MFMLLKSIWVWVFLQLKFCFLDTRLYLLKRVSVYHAALKTLELGEKRHRPGLGQQGVYLVDEGIFHVLLMHRFASLKEQAAWSFFARNQICKLVEDRDAIVFVLSTDSGLRRERLKRRNEIESGRWRVANNQKGLAFGPLGVEFIRSVTCDADGPLKVVVVDNNSEGGIESNVERIKAILLVHLAQQSA